MGRRARIVGLLRASGDGPAALAKRGAVAIVAGLIPCALLVLVLVATGTVQLADLSPWGVFLFLMIYFALFPDSVVGAITVVVAGAVGAVRWLWRRVALR